MQAPAPPQEPPVSVYLRLPNAKSLKVLQPARLTVSALKTNICQLMGIAVQDQVLIYRGHQLSQGKTVQLTEKAILHVKDMKDSHSEITINVVKHRPQTQNIFKINSQQIPTPIHPTQTIQHFLNRFLAEQASLYNLPKTYVVESGRILKHHRSFGEEKMQNGTLLHVILRDASVESDRKEDLDHEIFIRSVLKLSRNNSIMDRHKAESPQKYEPLPFNVLQPQIEQQNKQQTKISSQKIQVLEKLDLGGISKWNPEHEKISLYKEYPPRLYNPTKASLMSASQKVIKEKVTPLKFGLKNHKRYEGPKSQRDCHCKEKKIPEQNLKTQRCEPSDKWRQQNPPEPKPKPKRVNTRLSLKF